MKDLTIVTQEQETTWTNELIEVLQKDIVASEEFEPLKSVIVNVAPDYSSIISMRLAHGLSKNGEMVNIIQLDLPYDDDHEEKKKSYRALAESLIKMIVQTKSFKHIILATSSVNTGENLGNIANVFKTEIEALEGDLKPSLTSVALCQNVDSKYKADYFGAEVSGKVKFWWEGENKHA